ncbi:MAG: manganese efflux pump [Ruminiclostridium sp.]|nr:manganese efflux pump [Ruminiclostridium sp.]
MSIALIILIALGLAMDAFAVSVSCGLCVINKWYWNSFKVAFLFGSFQWGMLSLGWLTGFSLKNLIEPVDHWIAFALLSFIGIKMWKESIGENSKPLDLTSLKLMITLAVATSIDAFAAGISISALGFGFVIPSIYVGIITFTLCFIGVLLGCWIRNYNRFRKYLDRLGATLLIGIGIKILLNHLFQ